VILRIRVAVANELLEGHDVVAECTVQGFPFVLGKLRGFLTIVCYNVISKIPPLIRGKVIYMPIKTISEVDIDNAIRRYVAGECSLKLIAAEYHTTSRTLKTELANRGLDIRSMSDSQAIRHTRDRGTQWWKRFREAGRQAAIHRTNTNEWKAKFTGYAANAWAANTRRIHTEAEREARALTHERLRLKVSPYAIILNDWLVERGVQTTMEAACGRYNIDIACGPIAVEVHAYSFNPIGPTRLRERERLKYICNRGWLVLYVWISARAFVLDPRAADDIVATLKATKSDPALIGQYRVIRGSGQLVTTGRPDGDDWS
jgi:hypothetical protein